MKKFSLSKYIPLLSVVGFLLSCQWKKSEAVSSSLDTASLAAKEFEDLQLNLDIGWLGSYSRSSPSAAFMDAETTTSLISEMKSAVAGKSNNLRFLGCKGRSFFPDTMNTKECDYILDAKESDLEFRFLALDPAGKGCTLVESHCQIYQVVTLLSKNSGIQRPPQFAFKEAVSSKLLVLTNRVFYTQNQTVQDFFRRWTEADEFAALVVNPYDFPRDYGEELAGILGQCGKRFMNLVNLSEAAISSYRDRKKPVAITGIAAESAFMAANLLLGIRAPFAASEAFSLLRAKSLWKGTIMSLEVIGNVGSLPWIVTNLTRLDDHINQYPIGSSQRKAIQIALVISSFGDWANITQLSAISLKHWKATAKVLGVLAVGGAAGTVALREKHVDDLVNSLRHGKISAVRSRLCEMQKEAGLRKFCADSPIKKVCE